MSAMPPSATPEEWTRGGRPWRFWKGSGQFLYVFGEAIGDDDAGGPFASTAFKIGITTDPKSRLAQLRQKVTRGVWYDIQWLESSADVIEKALHELLNPWKCGFEKEWFVVPHEVSEWIFEGMADRWHFAQKQHRICGETVRTLVKEIFPAYYPAEWLTRRIEALNDF